MSRWLDELAQLAERGEVAVIVTVASVKGSVPREPGAKLIVTRERIFGTIGGGHLEFKAIEVARDMLASGGAIVLQRFPLGARLGQCCGGVAHLLFEPFGGSDRAWVDAARAARDAGQTCLLATPVRGGDKRVMQTNAQREGQREAAHEAPRVELRDDVLYEPIAPIDFNIVLFGAGHVGRALVTVLSGLPCHVTWVDEREDEFPREVPSNVTIEITDTPQSEVAQARPLSYFFVMTHSHALDCDLAEHILRRDDFAYFGLIGSATKRRTFEMRLLARGLDTAALQRMACPIGIDGIASKEPAAIAIAAAAEILQVRERTAALRWPAAVAGR